MQVNFFIFLYILRSIMVPLSRFFFVIIYAPRSSFLFFVFIYEPLSSFFIIKHALPPPFLFFVIIQASLSSFSFCHHTWTSFSISLPHHHNAPFSFFIIRTNGCTLFAPVRIYLHFSRAWVPTIDTTTRDKLHTMPLICFHLPTAPVPARPRLQELASWDDRTQSGR